MYDPRRILGRALLAPAKGNAIKFTSTGGVAPIVEPGSGQKESQRGRRTRHPTARPQGTVELSHLRRQPIPDYWTCAGH
jgi:hypothetical protein